jgi:hypothetical protein
MADLFIQAYYYYYYYHYYYLLSPLSRVFTIIYVKQTMFIGYLLSCKGNLRSSGMLCIVDWLLVTDVYIYIYTCIHIYICIYIYIERDICHIYRVVQI